MGQDRRSRASAWADLQESQEQRDHSGTVVFGATGFIGSHLLAGLRGAGINTVGVARRPLRGMYPLDLAAPETSSLPLMENRVTTAIIAAAVPGVATCERDPAMSRSVNVEGTVMLARQLADSGIRVIALSSDYVFDGRSGNYSESAPVNPLNEYGRQKAEMESRLLETCRDNVLILRLSKVFDTVKGSGTLLDEIAAKMLRGTPVPAASDQVFCPTSVHDLVLLLQQLLRSRLTGLLHACAPTRISRRDLALQVALAFGCDKKLVHAISLRDLHETFERPLDTSMVCRRLAQSLSFPFRDLAADVEELKSKYKVDHP